MKKLLVVAFSVVVTLALSTGHILSFNSGVLPFDALSVAEALPSPSGALSPYPANADFSAGESISASSTNYDFAQPIAMGAIPGWTISGDANQVSTPSGGDTGSGYFLQINGGACLCPQVTSSSVILSTDGQLWSFYTNSLGDAGALARIQVATGPDYTNWTQVFFGGSGAATGWVRQSLNLSAYAGQSVELQYSSDRAMGFDDAAWRIEAPNWTASGGSNDSIAFSNNVAMGATTASLGDYSNSEVTCNGAGVLAQLPGPEVTLVNGESIQSSFFTVGADVSRIFLNVAAHGLGPAASVLIRVSSDNYSADHVVYNKPLADGNNVSTSCDITHFAGQNAYIRIVGSFPGKIDVISGLPASWWKQKDEDKSKDPVSFTTGALSQQHTDMVVPGKGVPLAFSRTYSSVLGGKRSSLGWGWVDSYDANLTLYDDGSLQTQYPDGALAFFKNVSGTLTAPAGLGDSVVKNADNTYTLATTSQSKYNFSTTGKLTSIKDRNNNTTSVAYNGSGFLSTVTDPGGRQFVFTTDTSGRITQIAAPMTRTIGYGYDANGNLATVTDAKGGLTTFSYANNHLTGITDALNHVVATNIYDTANRVVEQRDGANDTSCFYYGSGPVYTSANCPAISPSAQPGQTILVDPRGNKEIHQFDTAFRPTGVEDALGHDTTFTYEANGALCSPANNGNLCSVADALGHTTSFTYDSKGDVLTRTDANNKTWTYTYNAFNDVLTATDPLTRVTTYTYNASGNLATVKDALNQTTTYTPNTDGTLASVKDPLLHTTSFGYDANGNRNRVTDALTHATTIVNDAGGRMTSVTDALTHATTYGYDNLNSLTSITDALTHATSYGYDAKGQRTTVTDANNKTTTFGYDNAGRLTTVTDPLNQIVTYGYDGNSNRTSMQNTRNKTTIYGYDAANRLTTVTDPLNRVTTYGYDAANRRTSRLDAKSQTTTYGYDTVDRVTSVTYPAGTPNVAYTYDALGNRLTMVDGTGTTTSGYDVDYRLTSVTDGANNVVGYGYDVASRLTTITYPGTTGAATYGYDNANRLTSVKDWGNKTTTYGYDNANRLTSTSFPSNVTDTRTYDNANRLLTILTKKQSTTIVSYTYTVDSVGNRSQVVDTNGTTTWGYDGLYRVNAVTYPNSDTQSYTYDPMGNRLTKVNNGTTTNYTTDDADQMTAAGATAYGYDNNGNQTSRGTDAYGYNAENRLTSTTLGGVSGSYTYNGNGSRTSRTVGGTTTTFAWGNVRGMPVILKDSAGNAYLYGLDLISRTDSAGSKFYYHTDGLGSTTAITDSTGTLKNSYQFDVYGAVRSQTGTTPNEFTYTGEQADSSGLEYLRARYYDNATGRFLSKDPLPLLQRYAYAGANPVNIADPMGLCSGPVDCLQSGLSGVGDALDKAGSQFAEDVRSLADLAVDCAESSQCRSAAGTLAVGAGILLTAPELAVPALIIGTGLLESVDIPACHNGDRVACVQVLSDLAGGVAGVADALGAPAIARAPEPIRGYQNAAWKRLNVTPIGYGLQRMSATAFNSAYDAARSRPYALGSLTLTIGRFLYDEAANR